MYVWRRFDDFCKDRFTGAVKLFTDKQAWSAVVRGPAIRGLNGNTVLSRKANKLTASVFIVHSVRASTERKIRTIVPLEERELWGLWHGSW